MKRFLIVLLVALGLIFSITACGNNPEESADAEMEEQNDTIVTEARKPVSDVVDGTGLQGTWTATQKTDAGTNQIVLALNSDNTFGIWIGDESGSEDSATEFNGTYTDNKDNLSLTPDIVDDATTYSFGDGSYPYTLDGDTLTMKDSQGQEIKFTRDKNN